MNKLRKLLIALLDDEHGISSQAYEELQSHAIEQQTEETGDIFAAVSSCEGRYFLPKDHGIVA